ncbi:MAG: DNA integrity scanning diadenylate cyclase DisA [Nanoarchaeota archaeon]
MDSVILEKKEKIPEKIQETKPLVNLPVGEHTKDKLLQKNQEKNDSNFLEIMKIFSPGTAMRTALDDIMRARMGALIVVEKEGMSKIIDGGFRINCRFSAQKLVELAKMDGAIVLSKDLKKILYANTLLVPKDSFKTSETGTRHKAAERTAKQLGTIVVAVSERRNKISLYWGEHRQVLENSSEILRRATESLQILEKQKEVLDDIIVHLNVLEITDLVSTSDVCNVLQRKEMIRRITDTIKRYLIELGKEGLIVSMRVKELTRNLDNERELILRDYFGSSHSKIDIILRSMNYDFLIETSNLLRLIFEELHDKSVFPRGFRILRKTGFLDKDLRILMNHFKSLGKLFGASDQVLVTVLGKQSVAESLKRNLESLKEKILEGKKI